MIDLKPTKLIIALNINSVNTLVKRKILSDKIQNQDPTLCTYLKTISILIHR